MVFLQAVSGIPADSPWWAALLFLALSGAAGWFARRQDRRDAERATAEAEERQHRRDIEERRAKAGELQAQAMDQISKTLAVMQFEISDIKRHLGMYPQGRARARGHTEGERGE